MPKVVAKDHERFESLMRRWKKLVEKSDTLNDYHKHEFYEKPTAVRKRKKAAAVKRWQRQSDEMNSNRKAV